MREKWVQGQRAWVGVPVFGNLAPRIRALHHYTTTVPTTAIPTIAVIAVDATLQEQQAAVLLHNNRAIVPHPWQVVALDRPDDPLIAKSCTGCWTGILKRINAEIEARRRAGEDLPPPPKTAIAGPEYFGLNQPNVSCTVCVCVFCVCVCGGGSVAA